ncbi:MAG: septum formation initiator family protein [bacterium]
MIIEFIKKINLLFVAYLIIILLGVAFLVFNDFGFIKYLEMKKEVAAMKKELERSQGVVKQLRMEIDSLKTSSYKIEQVAREKYNMIRPGEKVIKIIEE